MWEIFWKLFAAFGINTENAKIIECTAPSTHQQTHFYLDQMLHFDWLPLIMSQYHSEPLSLDWSIFSQVCFQVFFWLVTQNGTTFQFFSNAQIFKVTPLSILFLIGYSEWHHFWVFFWLATQNGTTFGSFCDWLFNMAPLLNFPL